MTRHHPVAYRRRAESVTPMEVCLTDNDAGMRHGKRSSCKLDSGQIRLVPTADTASNRRNPLFTR